MKDNWIAFDKRAIPIKTECEVFLYTPHSDEKIRFRVMSAAKAMKCKDATHWQLCAIPEGCVEVAKTTIKIIFNMINDSFKVKGPGTKKDHKKLVSTFLRTQCGAEEDISLSENITPSKDRTNQTILLSLDINSNAFSVFSDCRNVVLRDAILMKFLS